MKIITGGVSAPIGYKANGLYCGIKRSGKLDLGLIASEVPAVTAGVFTKNSVIAAPLIVTKKHLSNNRSQAVVVNSGNANCFTGHFGVLYAERTCQVIGELLNIPADDVLVTSTGIIGKTLPYLKIAAAAPQLVKGLKRSGGGLMAKSILTTDLINKEIAVKITVGGKAVSIGGCAKGSGMIAPNMATMLGFITSDAAVSAPMLKLALKTAVDKTFNCITVDGCMSTNDMVTLMTNGLAGNRIIKTSGKDFKIFCEALTHVCLFLAKKIVEDGEGATKFVEIHCHGAKDEKEARLIAMTVANSPLVKTALYGSNPNWGRVAAAVGSLGLNIKEEDLKIRFSSFAKKIIKIHTDVGRGSAHAVVYTSDLSHEYVTINGKYN
ncbi:MAG: bifunctional glutamate N-acetyltransferase/amino-acid acetyltransferase ArgJ [Candidatus Omnitrophota bacterium]|nr:bifunctional glutamate N-acetyltransferase/amino-acid acetyltransferase ArgJ [Candidatus Omnitrophota bacterium]MDZ4241515.1 bifunctional glutamate N-acetyltransferase/amino-acid acetyltransferase ArgJ [Candidatus Omnitrophota bacterium]